MALGHGAMPVFSEGTITAHAKAMADAFARLDVEEEIKAHELDRAAFGTAETTNTKPEEEL